MQRKPYIGVTGYTDREQVEEVLRTFPALTGKTMEDWQRLPVWHMAGVLVSSKTMRGETNKYPGRYPNIGSIPGIFPHDPRVLGLIHFHTDEDDVAEELKYLFEAIEYPTSVAGVQLNIAWPEPSQVRKFWHDFFRATAEREPYIVLQIGGDAFAMADHNPMTVARWIRDYKGSIDYVLLDPSGGTGQAFDPFEIMPYIRAIKSLGNGVGIGVAGGLSDIHCSQLTPVLGLHPDVSVDAEGRLMNDAGRLDTVKAVRYARRMVRSYLSARQKADVPA